MKISKEKGRLRKDLFLRKVAKSNAQAIEAVDDMLAFMDASAKRPRPSGASAAILAAAKRERDERPFKVLVSPDTSCGSVLHRDKPTDPADDDDSGEATQPVRPSISGA